MRFLLGPTQDSWSHSGRKSSFPPAGPALLGTSKCTQVKDNEPRSRLTSHSGLG